jgi:hypothetical protein
MYHEVCGTARLLALDSQCGPLTWDRNRGASGFALRSWLKRKGPHAAFLVKCQRQKLLFSTLWSSFHSIQVKANQARQDRGLGLIVGAKIT